MYKKREDNISSKELDRQSSFKKKIDQESNIFHIGNEDRRRETLGFSSSKGQWFLISAIMATGVFLVISGLFKTYLAQDSSPGVRANEDYFFDNIKGQFNEVKKSSCADIDKNLRDFRSFVTREMASHGYLFYMNYSSTGCSISNPSMFIASERYVICQNLDAKAIVPQVEVNCAKV